MRQLFSKTGLRHLSLIVAIVLLLASVPSTAGFIVLSWTKPARIDRQRLPADSNVRPRVEHIARTPCNGIAGVCSQRLRLDHGKEDGAISRLEGRPRHPAPKAHCIRIFVREHSPDLCL